MTPVQRIHLETRISEFSGPVFPQLLEPVELSAQIGNVAGVLTFGDDLEIPEEIPHLRLPMRRLSAEPRVEAWISDRPVQWQRRGGLRFATNGGVLFGTTTRNGRLRSIAEDTRSAYEEILSLLREQNYPGILRIWNHVARINEEIDGLEVYRRFCIGRHEAFASNGYGLAQDLPAASAVGMNRGELGIAFLAARGAAQQIENPRQVSAWAYPPRYGPRSPSFSRAAFKRWLTSWHLYISGTASIVGHESQHPGDLEAQFQETLRNLARLRETAARHHPETLRATAALYKIYLRRNRDADRVASLARAAFGAEASTLLLEAEICRKELLLEIEAVFAGTSAEE